MLSGSTGTPASRISCLASIFEPMAAIADGGGPIQISPASTTDWANAAFSTEEAVAGMHRVATASQGGGDQQIAAQVGVGGGVAGERPRHVGFAHVRRVGVGFGEDGDRADAHAAAGADDPAGDLAAVGDQDV